MGGHGTESPAPSLFDRLLLRMVFALARPGRGPGGGRATGILHAFALAERLLEPWYRADPVQAGGVLAYEITRLPHGTRPLPLHPPVRAGDQIVRLHFNNQSLAQLAQARSSPRHLAWEVTRRTAQDLTVLAHMAESGEFPDGTRAIWAETVIYPAMARLGFEVRAARSSPRRPFARLYILTLMAIYGPPGLIERDLTRLQHYQLGEAWMDLPALIQRYRPEGD